MCDGTSHKSCVLSKLTVIQLNLQCTLHITASWTYCVLYVDEAAIFNIWMMGSSLFLVKHEKPVMSAEQKQLQKIAEHKKFKYIWDLKCQVMIKIQKLFFIKTVAYLTFVQRLVLTSYFAPTKIFLCFNLKKIYGLLCLRFK